MLSDEEICVRFKRKCGETKKYVVQLMFVLLYIFTNVHHLKWCTRYSDQAFYFAFGPVDFFL